MRLPWPHQAQWVCVHLSGPPPLAPPGMWLAPPGMHQWCLEDTVKPVCPVGSSPPQETYSSGRQHTTQGGVEMGAQFGGAASLGGGVGAPHEEHSSEVGKMLQRHHVLLLQAQCGSEPPAGPWAHCPHSPSACRMPAPHGCPVKGSLLASLPGSRNCLCFLSQADWTLWGSSAQGHKSYPGKRE